MESAFRGPDVAHLMIESNIAPFVPRWGLRGPHRQTLASYFLRRANRLPAPENRLVKVNDDTRLLCHCNWQQAKQSSLTVVIVHGLAGSSASPHVVGLAGKAWVAGMNVVRINMRNCGGSETLTPTLYHSGLSSDVGAVVRELILRDRCERLALTGYSMGANLVLKLAGEWGEAPPREVRALAVISPLTDLSASSDALHLRENRLYEWQFVFKLSRLLRRKAELFPGRFDTRRLKGIRSLREFDDRIVGPYNGFAGADDYYERARSSRCAEKICVPTFIIHSTDDPFIRILPETRAKIAANPNIRFLETERGGHCAFLAAPAGYDGRWAERQVVAFLRQF
jgi:predicted alpha/beta-fold hydrolase